MTEPEPRRTWSVSQRHAPLRQEAAEADLFSLAADTSDGYAQWQAEKQARRRDFEQAWGIRLGHRVRVQLRNERSPREGIIQLLDDLPDQIKPDQRPTLRLRIGDHHLLPNQIESLSVID